MAAESADSRLQDANAVLPATAATMDLSSSGGADQQLLATRLRRRPNRPTVSHVMHSSYGLAQQLSCVSMWPLLKICAIHRQSLSKMIEQPSDAVLFAYTNEVKRAGWMHLVADCASCMEVSCCKILGTSTDAEHFFEHDRCVLVVLFALICAPRTYSPLKERFETFIQCTWRAAHPAWKL